MSSAGNPQGGWEWPDALDALNAAPRHHRLLLENDEARVLDTRIGPREMTPVHTHRWPAVLYVLASDHFVRRDAEGTVLVDTRSAPARLEPGVAVWTPPLPPHSLENVGDSEIRVLSVELKRT